MEENKVFLTKEEIEQYYELMFDEKNSILTKEDRMKYLELSDVIKKMEDEYDKLKELSSPSEEESHLISKYESFFKLIYKFDSKLLSSIEIKKTIGSLSSETTPSNYLKSEIFRNTLDNRHDQDEQIDYSLFITDDEVQMYVTFISKLKKDRLTKEEYFLYSSVSLKIFYLVEAYNNLILKENKENVDYELIKSFETIFKKIDMIKVRMLSTEEIKEYIDVLLKKEPLPPRGELWHKELENELNARNILNL